MIELKRGYNSESPLDLIDKPATAAYKDHSIEGWVSKLEDTLSDSGTFSWWLIHRKDRRTPIVYLPAETIKVLRELEVLSRLDGRYRAIFWVPVRVFSGVKDMQVVAIPFADWLELLDPVKLRKRKGSL